MPRRIIVHDHAQLRTAQAVAAALGVPVILQSAPAAAGYLGPGYFRGTAVVLDCGDAPGHALAALRAGHRRIRLAARPEVLRKLAEMGAELDPDDAPALDLAEVPKGRWEQAVRDWLTFPDRPLHPPR